MPNVIANSARRAFVSCVFGTIQVLQETTAVLEVIFGSFWRNPSHPCPPLEGEGV